jgi:hypothetical protein
MTGNDSHGGTREFDQKNAKGRDTGAYLIEPVSEIAQARHRM